MEKQLAELSVYILIIFLILGFIMAILMRFGDDTTLFDLTQLPKNNPKKLNYYVQPAKNPNENVPFKTIFDKPQVYVSFIVPAYNEEKRLPKMLEETIEYLEQRRYKDNNFTWEIVVVNDGSKDRTAHVVLEYAERYSNIFLLNQPHNMGKGAAIQAGCLHARGQLVLMVDADGATKISDFGLLENEIKKLMKNNKEAIVVGSRTLNEDKSKVHRTFIRKILGLGMHILIVISGVHGIKDTQCGFKLFTRDACKMLFMNQHVQRWCFDPELLVIARRRKMKVSEISVEWNEIEGSKMKISGMIKMAIDLLRIAVFYRLNIWTIRDRKF
ncbi:glycosyl transferase, group 2 family protein [Trichomonas vaginalis G3]|uniref:Dolichyl-phosphate beta-glucosyltransferase ALG5D n=1 Tax=Trichomonas vaginalis (strain ATCC PRA-98 / G3) TaxID=412133 RepID=ALG5D_TRIV3|nr:glycosyl transferase [Trichomonas vaginalis G3]A2E3C6.1 RecName: Full=Dolichyl-phosphate beta-glucosyltransferase ALG5D; Short=DolP-glucosyltransferase [Trichomonas vaginalis G3]EAY12817.1 glycosyl transferase, group 2 family protein [Trichomonas vaginalis G3]KAI5488525.1 Dolichyl-phosphate beta-glucosyltransferase ALG5D [Trichomonas vaginalis G3]|eukprot:XP_001325040.1 glycosyl transferase [Trichomonas vaginalis G3]